MKIVKARIKLESFDSQILDSTCQKITNVVENDAVYRLIYRFSIITLPTKKRAYCVLSSPHVDKDSREHFEVRIHKRTIEIHYDPGLGVGDLYKLVTNIPDMPSGVSFVYDFF